MRELAPEQLELDNEGLHDAAYRPDIDGLRAIAVVIVVLFHAFPQWLKGGFIGVDIFFVISGYLITRVILNNVSKDCFSLQQFYASRIRRIVPALILVLLFCYLVGWNTLFKDEFKLINKHIAAGLGFIYNLLAWSEAGYFDISADHKPLLHLWSLGIEEQFYIFWPFFVWLCVKRINYLHSLILICFFCAISFSLNIWYLYNDPIGAFYSPVARFWELMVGAFLVCLNQNTAAKRNCFHMKYRQITSISGVALIFIGLIFIDNKSAFPGAWALMPTIGAALIIYSTSKAWFNRVILSNSGLVWVGLISYPLYLWHWPLLSFFRILFGEKLPDMAIIISISASVVISWITFKFIEGPIRSRKAFRESAVLLLTSTMLIIGLISIYSYYAEKGFGLNRKFNEINMLSASGFDGGDSGYVTEECGIKDSELKKLLPSCARDRREAAKFALIGDSKASALWGGLVRKSKTGGRWLFIGGNGPNGAPIPIISASSRYSHFQAVTDLAINAIIGNIEIKTVVIAVAIRSIFELNNNYSIEDLEATSESNYADALAGLKASIKILLDAGKKVVLILDNPSLKDPSQCMPRKTGIKLIEDYIQIPNQKYCSITVDGYLAESRKYRMLFEDVKAISPDNIYIFETISILCDSGLCSISKNGRLMYSYTDHISDFAAGLIGIKINEFVGAY